MVDQTAVAPAAPRTDARAGSSALAARRWILILAPALAGVCAVVAAAADPGVDQDGAAMYAAYAADPDSVQVKSLAYHLSYALMGAAALMLVGLVRRRGGWLANVGGVLAWLGISTIPGFLLADFYDSAIGQVFGAEGTVQVNGQMEGMWALMLMAATGGLGLLLGLPVAALAAWRGGLVPWWAPAAVVAGLGGGFMAIGANVAGAAVMTAGFAVLSVALARADRSAWTGSLPASGPAD
ncbi:MAG: hypothetical protein M3Q47_12285 [Actinomycetota bacterium]|nr:hypothetical protein [Actinomycetota bacterium]